jgi:FKBP-type peptidyl-prolyl cis-trans isomerase
MKTSNIFLAFLALSISFAGCNKVPKSGKIELQSSIDSVSYALGFIEANNYIKTLDQVPFQFDSIEKVHLAKAIAKSHLKEKYIELRSNQFDSLNEDAFFKGFLNELAYGKSYFNETSADTYLRKVFGEKKAIKESLQKEVSKANLLKGQKYLDDNGKREGVIATESGLQYEILKEGNGKVAQLTDRVKCVYHGTLLNGTVFDSSKERGDTTAFGVTQVIKGWTEALQIMPEGSEWRLFVPAGLAYGERGSGAKVGSNETLIFDINLVEVVEK